MPNKQVQVGHSVMFVCTCCRMPSISLHGGLCVMCRGAHHPFPKYAHCPHYGDPVYPVRLSDYTDLRPMRNEIARQLFANQREQRDRQDQGEIVELQNFLESYNRLRWMVFPLRLWVVDRPALIVRMRRLVDSYVERTISVAAMTISGMEVVEWSSFDATPDEWRRAPWFCAIPGVWVEMVNAPHQFVYIS